jgi:hypothetical protein
MNELKTDKIIVNMKDRTITINGVQVYCVESVLPEILTSEQYPALLVRFTGVDYQVITQQ